MLPNNAFQGGPPQGGPQQGGGMKGYFGRHPIQGGMLVSMLAGPRAGAQMYKSSVNYPHDEKNADLDLEIQKLTEMSRKLDNDLLLYRAGGTPSRPGSLPSSQLPSGRLGEMYKHLHDDWKGVTMAGPLSQMYRTGQRTMGQPGQGGQGGYGQPQQVHGPPSIHKTTEFLRDQIRPTLEDRTVPAPQRNRYMKKYDLLDKLHENTALKQQLIELQKSGRLSGAGTHTG